MYKGKKLVSRISLVQIFGGGGGLRERSALKINFQCASIVLELQEQMWEGLSTLRIKHRLTLTNTF